MNVMFATYPMAFHTPGGGEIQLLAYRKHLMAQGVGAALFDPWNPSFLEHDIVHFFSCIGGSFHFCKFVKQLGLPLVVSASLWITEETKHLYPMEEIHAQLELADKIITNSDMECQTLSEVLGLPRERFCTVYNSVDALFLKEISPTLFREQYNIHEKFVLTVGNIEPRKNQLRIVQAVKSFSDYKMVLIGHVRDKDYFNKVMEYSGEQVIHIDPVPHESPLLRSAYRACDVFALISTLETPGLAALEAAAQETSLVLTREGSTKEYFGEDAIYADPHSAISINNGIRNAIEKEKTFLAKKRLKNRIKNKYTWPDAAKKLISIYHEVGSK